jgi:hypothetical protein
MMTIGAPPNVSMQLTASNGQKFDFTAIATDGDEAEITIGDHSFGLTGIKAGPNEIQGTTKFLWYCISVQVELTGTRVLATISGAPTQNGVYAYNVSDGDSQRILTFIKAAGYPPI